MSANSTIELFWGTTIGGVVGGYSAALANETGKDFAAGVTTGLMGEIVPPIVGDILAGALSDQTQAGVLGLAYYAKYGQGNPQNINQLNSLMNDETGSHGPVMPYLPGEILYWVRLAKGSLAAGNANPDWAIYEFHTYDVSLFVGQPHGPNITIFDERGVRIGEFISWYVQNLTGERVDINRTPILIAPYYFDPSPLLSNNSIPVSAIVGGIAEGGEVAPLTSISASLLGDYGTFKLNSNGTFSYTITPGIVLPLGFHPSDQFSYSHAAINGGVPNVFDVVINRSPDAVDDNFTADGHGLVIAAGQGVLANDGDDDGDAIRISAIDGQIAAVGSPVLGSFGTLTLNADGSLAYHLTADAVGNGSHEQFVYEIFDGQETQTGLLDISVLANIGADELVGDGSANRLFGGAGSDRLSGNGGNDTLLGGSDDDFLVGGLGGDTLDGGEGLDTADYSGASAGLTADLLTPSSNTGEAAGDTYVSIENLRGSGFNDTLRGDGGNNVLNGGAGTDGMSGRGGDDTYIVDNVGDRVYESTTPTSGIDASGVDTVLSSVTMSIDAYSAVRFVENLTLTGAASINGFGNGLNNVMTGNSGNNTLDGGLGNDIMGGGAGNDIYVVDSIADQVFETTTISSAIDAGGIDAIQSSVALNLDTNVGLRFVERLTLTGAGNIDAIGNALGNVLLGNSGNNSLDGGLGVDLMVGGAGNDTYVVDNAGDRVFETTTVSTQIDAGGVDTMLSSISTSIDAYIGVRFVENLTLTGTGNLVAVGNALNNELIGNTGNNTLNGGLGADTMGGGAGNDIYVVDNIGDQVFETTTISSGLDAGGIDTIQSSVTQNLDANAGLRFVERLTLTGTGNINGDGNALANVLLGNSGNNTLDGDLGADIMGGGAGNDIYIVDNIADFVFETTTISTLIDAGGVDTVLSSVTTNLDAGVGARFVENLTLTGAANINGTGNALANVLTGNSGNNTLNGGLGNDMLDGGIGTDGMSGGSGDDMYIVDNIGDRVYETTTPTSGIDTGGVDTVLSSVTMSLNAYAAVRFVENLTLTGTVSVNGFGNGLNNVMIGNSGNNTLDGGLGNDIMGGGEGDDIYVVDSIGDQVFETTTISSQINTGGFDEIRSSVTLSLDANAGVRFVERLVLTGTENIDGIGNALRNMMFGNAGNNTLNGGLGDDVLIGDLGADTFVFDTTLVASNIDQITGFSVVDDTIRLDDAIFVGLAPGASLAGTAFAANLTGQANDAFDRIIYETDTGALFYDADGLGGEARVQFATLSPNLALTNADFFVF